MVRMCALGIALHGCELALQKWSTQFSTVQQSLPAGSDLQGWASASEHAPPRSATAHAKHYVDSVRAHHVED